MRQTDEELLNTMDRLERQKHEEQRRLVAKYADRRDAEELDTVSLAPRRSSLDLAAPPED
ncbi:MAG: hypothetical protein ABGZ53_30385 [Fuerstiella sp.]